MKSLAQVFTDGKTVMLLIRAYSLLIRQFISDEIPSTVQNVLLLIIQFFVND